VRDGVRECLGVELEILYRNGTETNWATLHLFECECNKVSTMSISLCIGHTF